RLPRCGRLAAAMSRAGAAAADTASASRPWPTCSRRQADPGEGLADLPVRAGALELAQQAITALGGGIKRDLCRLLATESLLQLVLDRIANQHHRSEPDAFRILRRRMQRDLLDRDRCAR